MKTRADIENRLFEIKNEVEPLLGAKFINASYDVSKLSSLEHEKTKLQLLLRILDAFDDNTKKWVSYKEANDIFNLVNLKLTKIDSDLMQAKIKYNNYKNGRVNLNDVDGYKKQYFEAESNVERLESVKNTMLTLTADIKAMMDMYHDDERGVKLSQEIDVINSLKEYFYV